MPHARKSPKKPRPLDQDVYSIEVFCERIGISIPHYYKMREEGKAPREIHLGNRKLITREAATEWRAARDREAREREEREAREREEGAKPSAA
jgi:predicted DNA-binding transcriptional regulator AlpA